MYARTNTRNYEHKIGTDKGGLTSLYPRTGKCLILGIDTELGGDRENSPTIDRLDNSKDYVTGDVTWISYRANYVKGNATKAEILSLADWLKDK